jgi:predicted dehydrogenase
MKAAVIGTGRIARQHLDCLRELPDVEIAAVCDLSPAVAEATAERYQASAWYTDTAIMFDEMQPDIVHVTTPPHTHYRLALSAIESGSHAIVEKPITARYEEFKDLRERAERKGVWLIEDHNLRFNNPVQRIVSQIERGEFGEIVHVEVHYLLNILGPRSAFGDPNNPHPTSMLAGGAIADFITHLAYLAYYFVGRHRSVAPLWLKRSETASIPYDEFRALIEAENGTALISFSAHVQPDACWLWVQGSKMTALANLFTGRLVFDRVLGASKLSLPFQNAFREAKEVSQSPFRVLWRKVSGQPLIYDGLWELLKQVYRSAATGGSPPLSLADIENVAHLINDLTDGLGKR